MDNKTKGAWIVHHTHKLDQVKLQHQDFAQIGFAGKCATMLNALAHSDQVEISFKKVETLARANGINPRLELPSILEELEKQRVIDQGNTGISILGLTTVQTLERAAAIFDESSPDSREAAALGVAEMASELPIDREDAEEYISDTFKLPSDESDELCKQFETIGFVDSEQALGRTVMFNGNLFRREAIKKVDAVLSSLNSQEESKVREISSRLKSAGCLSKVIQFLGERLFSKLSAIGFLDESAIANEKGDFSFITRPAAFAKFGNPAVEDAFDLAKAFVTSLTFGMTQSGHSRGKIQMIEALMRRLIQGLWVGPATAIGKDYKILELKGVIRLRQEKGDRFSMKLRKKEVGVLALEVITEGGTVGDSLLHLPSASATAIALR